MCGDIMRVLADLPDGVLLCSADEIKQFDATLAQAVELNWVTQQYDDHLAKFRLTMTPAGRSAAAN